MQKKRSINKMFLAIIGILLAIIFVAPILILVNSSFKTLQEIYIDILALPEHFSFQNYLKAFEKMDFLHSLINSLVITCVATVLILLVSSMAAWVMVRYKTKVSKVLFIVFSAASGGVSVAALLMAGWIPGLLWALLCMVVAFVYGKKHGYVIKRDHLTAKVVLKTIWDAIPSLFLIVIIIGGILSGYFTPTEASGVAVVYAFILAVFVYKSIRIKDIPRILELLKQVLQIHADIRPDIFIPDTTKYTTDELTELLKNKEKPVYVAVNEDDVCIGYAFCQLQEQPFSNNMVQFKSLFIDDLCVDQEARGQHIGESLFEYVKSEAKQLGCYEVTLNVWAGNISAEKFYEKMGMRTKERQMEYIL